MIDAAEFHDRFFCDASAEDLEVVFDRHGYALAYACFRNSATSPDSLGKLRPTIRIVHEAVAGNGALLSHAFSAPDGRSFCAAIADPLLPIIKPDAPWTAQLRHAAFAPLVDACVSELEGMDNALQALSETVQREPDAELRSLLIVGAVAVAVGLFVLYRRRTASVEFREFAAKWAGRDWADALLSEGTPHDWRLDRAIRQVDAGFRVEIVRGLSIEPRFKPIEPAIGEPYRSGAHKAAPGSADAGYVVAVEDPGLRRDGGVLLRSTVRVASSDYCALHASDHPYTAQYLSLCGEGEPDPALCFDEDVLADVQMPASHDTFDNWLAQLIENAPARDLAPAATQGDAFNEYAMIATTAGHVSNHALVAEVAQRGLVRESTVLIKAEVSTRDRDGVG